MSIQARQARVGMNLQPYNEARQEPSPGSTSPTDIASSTSKTTSTSSTLPPQPTTVVPLTTTFTPPASCTENHLSMLPSPGYFIWMNEPVPAENVTSSACYPSEFLRGYHSVTSGELGSSIVPAMSPLICPTNFCTMLVGGDDNYVVCCPSEYRFALPKITNDPKRPGYGGTCYSELTSGSTYTVTQFNVTGNTNLAQWIGSTTSGQAYAHPIDGFAPSGVTPTIGCPSLSSSSSSPGPRVAAATPSPATNFGTSSPISKGLIAGVSVGAVVALSAIIFLVWLILRVVRNRKAASASRPTIQHIDHDLAKTSPQPDDSIAKQDDSSSHYDDSMAKSKQETVHEKDGSVFIFEMASADKHGQVDKVSFRQSQLNGGQGAFEMHGDLVPELDGGPVGKKGETADAKIGFAA